MLICVFATVQLQYFKSHRKNQQDATV